MGGGAGGCTRYQHFVNRSGPFTIATSPTAPCLPYSPPTATGFPFQPLPCRPPTNVREVHEEEDAYVWGGEGEIINHYHW